MGVLPGEVCGCECGERGVTGGIVCVRVGKGRLRM